MIASGAVSVGGWLKESGKEVDVAGGCTFTILQRVGEGRNELDPAPDASVVLADLGYVLECLMLRVYMESGGKQMPAESFNRPDGASGLGVEGVFMNVRCPRWRA